MDDLVKRLRISGRPGPLENEAADCIEALEAELHGTVTTAYHDKLMQDWQMVVDKGNDKGKEIEKSLTAEVQVLKWRLGYAETALGVWDESKSSEYWNKYPEKAPLPDSISGRDQ